jgi:hypothetical protein
MVLLATGISQAQDFPDGNKRTAFASLGAFLWVNGWDFVDEPLELARRFEQFAEGTRVCRHLCQARAQTRWTPARAFLAVVSSRVAMARKCLMMLKQRSTRLPSQESAKSHSL